MHATCLSWRGSLAIVGNWELFLIPATSIVHKFIAFYMHSPWKQILCMEIHYFMHYVPFFQSFPLENDDSILISTLKQFTIYLDEVCRWILSWLINFVCVPLSLESSSWVLFIKCWLHKWQIAWSFLSTNFFRRI
jgi:hypothetical protein